MAFPLLYARDIHGLTGGTMPRGFSTEWHSSLNKTQMKSEKSKQNFLIRQCFSLYSQILKELINRTCHTCQRNRRCWLPRRRLRQNHWQRSILSRRRHKCSSTIRAHFTMTFFPDKIPLYLYLSPDALFVVVADPYSLSVRVRRYHFRVHNAFELSRLHQSTNFVVPQDSRLPRDGASRRRAICKNPVTPSFLEKQKQLQQEWRATRRLEGMAAFGTQRTERRFSLFFVAMRWN